MAGEGDAERLVVLLEARTNDALKAMERAEKKFDGTYAGMRKGSKTATQQMEADMNRTTGSINRAIAATSTKIGAFGKGLIGGLAGGLVAGGLTGIVSRLGQVASGVAAIGDEAKRAGLGVKAFQELKYVAEQNRIGVDALTDGMKELNLRADEWIVTGGGAAAEAFQRLGYTAGELNTKLQNPSALLTEIIGKVQGLDRAAQIRIFDELFGGTGGEQFVQLISQGEEGIQRTIDEAHALGIVMDEQVIAKAAEVDRKFNQIANTVGSGVKGAIVSATAALLEFLNAQNEAIKRNRLMAMSDDAKRQYDEQIALLEEYLAAAERVAPEVADRIRAITEAYQTSQKSGEDAIAELRALGGVNLDAFPITAGLSGVITQLEMMIGRIQTAKSELAAVDPIGAGATWDGLQNTFFPKPTRKPGSGGGGGGGRDKAAADAEREAKAVQNLIAGLEFERSLIGLSALEQQKLTTLRQAGAAATDQQREKISALVEATYAEQMRVEQLQATFDMLGQVGMTAVEGIIGALDDGKITAEEFGDILSSVLKQAANFFLQMAMNGLGSAFGGMGGLGGGSMGMFGIGGGTPLGFGGTAGIYPGFPSFAGGGSTGYGPRSGGVDGLGGFPAILHPNETVIDHTRPANQNSAAPQKVQIEVSISVDEGGNIVPLVRQVAGEEADIRVSAYNEGMPDRIRDVGGNRWKGF